MELHGADPLILRKYHQISTRPDGGSPSFLATTLGFLYTPLYTSIAAGRHVALHEVGATAQGGA